MRRHVVERYPTADELREGVPGLYRTYRVRPPIARLEQRYVAEPNGCWRWTGSFTGTGYGHFSIRAVYYQAHLLLYILHRGPIPAGLEADHLCRNRWCVNPWHLDPVTHQTNTRRGRVTRLIPDQVIAIRRVVASGVSQRKTARLFGINHSTVSRIVRRLLWADVTDPHQQEAA